MSDEQTTAGGAVKESPQLPETQREAKPETSSEDQTKALLAELTRLKINKPEELANVAKASYQAGAHQRALGDARKEIDQLKGQLQMLTEMSRRGQTQPMGTDNPDGQTIDLAALIEQKSYIASKKASKEAVMEAMQEMSAAQRKQALEFASIRKDRTYGQLEKAWNEYLTTPEAQEQLFAGTTPKELFADLKTAYMERLLDQSRETIERLAGQSPDKAKPLHVESSQTRVPSLPQEEDDKKAELNKIDELRRSGRMSSDQAMRAIFDRVSPKDDPIWNVSTAPQKKR